MPTYKITRQTLPINWDAVPVTTMDNYNWLGEAPIHAQAQICCTEDALHILLSTQEEHIRAEETGQLGAPCHDSCLEFFFCPVSGDDRYFNIECSPTGCIFLGFGSDRHNLVRLLPVEMSIHPEVKRFEGGWSVSYSVPYSFIRQFFPAFDPAGGSAMRGNFYKCGDETVQPHYISWSPMNPQIVDFHRPEHFGALIFE